MSNQHINNKEIATAKKPRNDASNLSLRGTKQSVSLTPKLRFKEFAGDWEFDKMNNITSYVDYRGRAPIKSNSGIFLVTAKNIKKGFIDYEKSKEFVPSENYNLVMSKGLPQKGDILFTTEAPLGNIALVDNPKIALAQRVIKLRGKENIDNIFLLHYMLAPIYQKLIIKKSIGTTVQGISGKELRKTKVSFPNLQEQQKIAAFITSVDDKIQQLTKKKTLLEQYKKGVMQQIFSQQLRFKADDGSDFADWEEKKLGEVAKVITGSTPSTSNQEYYGGKKLFVSPADIQGNRYVFNTKTTLTELGFNKGRKVKKNSVLFVCIGSTIGKVAQASEECLTNQQLNVLEALETNSNDFIFSILSFNGDRIKLLAGVQAVPQINKTDFSNFKFKFPSLKEQQKIATYLSAIDTKIENVQTQIAKTQTFKKGLLQQMFV
ncbi:restriction endonuclease subunit S [Polaribacter sp. NJDZ03]|uniref:restriction endonuclease subunit S n=1 Tax=Polaribacter sp. NJDZ03 TaxID=2855841 RepID=UPI001C4A0D81|nr:restriction endonuclease subunit S [Polaribacter sp. NJDZ03]